MIKRIALLATITAAVSACVSVQEARDVAMPATNAKTFTFEKTLASDVVVTKYDIQKAIKRGLTKAAAYNRDCQPICKWSKGHFSYVRGAVVDRSGNDFVLTYRKGSIHHSSGDKSFNDAIAKFPTKIEEKDDKWVVTMSNPSSFHKTRGNDEWFLFKTDAEFTNLYNSVLPKLTPEALVKHVDTGSFNVAYDPASVVTSLNRKLQTMTKTTQGSGGYSVTYKLKHNNQLAKAEVKVFLNKGKSLVEYSITQDVIVDGKGSSSFDKTAMSAFKQQLVDAANS